MLFKRLVTAVFLVFFVQSSFASEGSSDSAVTQQRGKKTWQFEAGMSVGRPTPIMINGGVGYKNVFFRVMGGGFRFGPDDFWTGFRGSVAWKFFRDLPFSLDLGLGGGYAFAKAPNEIHKALNRANGKRYVRSYNYKESLDISAEVRANIYGVFTQIGIPVHYFMKHDEPTVLWQVGYAYKF